MDRQRNAIHQTMGDADGVNGEWTNLETFTGSHLIELGVIEKTVFFQLVFDVGQGEFGPPNRYIQFGEHPRQTANVVLVTMREDNATHALAIFHQVFNVGDHDVDAQQFCFGEHQAGIDDNNVVSPPDGHAVHSELAQPAQGYDLQFSSWHLEFLDASTIQPARAVCRGRKVPPNKGLIIE